MVYVTTLGKNHPAAAADPEACGREKGPEKRHAPKYENKRKEPGHARRQKQFGNLLDTGKIIQRQMIELFLDPLAQNAGSFPRAHPQKSCGGGNIGAQYGKADALGAGRLKKGGI